MNIYFSPSTKGFYISKMHGEKGAVGAITPSDAIPVTKEQHGALLKANALGEEIVVVSGKVVTRTITLAHEESLTIVRSMRDKRLADCDWTQYPDSPLSDAKRQEWVDYRQALRDFPATLSVGFDIDKLSWPVEPA